MLERRLSLFTGTLRKIFQWYARAFIIPFGLATYHSIRLLWIGYVEPQPEVIPYAIILALLSFTMMTLFMILGFAGPDPIQELREELTNLRQEFEDIKKQTECKDDVPCLQDGFT